MLGRIVGRQLDSCQGGGTWKHPDAGLLGTDVDKITEMLEILGMWLWFWQYNPTENNPRICGCGVACWKEH
jgi:hypothetical protein